MNKLIKILLILLSIIGLIVCTIWFYKSPGFDSGAAAITSLIALVGLFFIDTGDGNGNIKMSQNAGKKSKLYQSKGSIKINNK